MEETRMHWKHFTNTLHYYIILHYIITYIMYLYYKYILQYLPKQK